jgi:putative endonuclease
MSYFVYILSNKHRNVFYVGVSNDLRARISEHRVGVGGYFTRKYNCHDLIYYEIYDSILEAIKREKILKKWTRAWKEKLIKKVNGEMKGISAQWFGII